MASAFMGFGKQHGGNLLNDWWKYDMASNTFTQLSPLPGPARFHPAMVAVQADRGQGAEWLIYVGCGSGVTSDGRGINLKDWWEYRVNTNAWTQRDDLPGPARVS